MQKRSSEWHRVRQGLVLLALAFAVPDADAQPIPSEAREILVAGDEVAGFGRVGTASFTVVGIARDDRVVFTGVTSTGATGVFSTAASGIQVLWLVGEPDDDSLRLRHLRSNANRVVYAAGFAQKDFSFNDVLGFYQVGGGALSPLIELGDTTPDGDEICNLVDFVVSDAGAVGFSAYAAPVEAACAFAAWSENLYIAEGGAIRRVLRTGDAQPPQFELIGLADDGTLLVALSDNSAIVAVGEGSARTIVSREDLAPNGTPFGEVRGGASNSLGEVAFYGGRATLDPVLYRTDNGRILRVAGHGDPIADPYEIESFSESTTGFNDVGDVVVRTRLCSIDEPAVRESAMLFPIAGEPRVLAEDGVPAGVNDSGVAAVLERESGLVVARGSAAPLERLVEFGDASPDGGVFAAGGIFAQNIAPDGRVTALVTRGDDSSALACGDAEGFVALTDPGGGSSAFAETGVLFLDRRGEESASVYLVSDTGLERLVGPGDETTDGARILTLVSFFDGFSGPLLASNAGGTVLVRAMTDAGVRFVRRYPAGEPESILFDLGPDLPIQRYIGAGIMDDDTVVASVGLVSGEYAILTSDGTSSRVLVAGSDPRLPGGPFEFMWLPFVVGQRVVIEADVAGSAAKKTVLYTGTDGFVPFFPDGVERSVQDATAGGRALVEELDELSQFLLTPDGTLSPVTVSRQIGDPRAVAINDRGNVLFFTDGIRLGTRTNLSLAGPAPSVRCPRGPATEPPTPTATVSSTEPPVPTETRTSLATSTPTRSPLTTETPSSTRTAEPTQTEPPVTQSPVDTPTAVSASPTVTDPLRFSDGCQIAAKQRAFAWELLLPILTMLALGQKKSKSTTNGPRRRKG